MRWTRARNCCRICSFRLGQLADDPVFREALAGLIKDVFEQPPINNTERSAIVERFVRIAGGNSWRLVGGWEGWDLQHASGFRLEAKQSAARQPWTGASVQKPDQSAGRFDIEPRKMRWEKNRNAWVDDPGRQAHGYILAWHGVIDASDADHRNPHQWEFFGIKSSDLPVQKSIGLNPLKRLAAAVPFVDLGAKLAQMVKDWEMR
jgi:hypothetical protein